MIIISMTAAPDGTLYGLGPNGSLYKWNPSLKQWDDA